MIVVKEEQPFALAVKAQYLGNTCSFCLAHKSPVFKCKGCYTLSYCNKNCQKSDWINHKKECPIFLTNKHIPFDVRLALRILLKSEEKLAERAFNGCTWDSLEDHFTDILIDRRFGGLKREVTVIKRIMESVKKVSEGQIVNTLAKVKTNHLQVYECVYYADVIAHGIYLGLSALAESCLPTAQVIFVGRKATLRRLNHYENTSYYCPDLTISRVFRNPFEMINRTREFEKHYYYSCQCALCTDNEHFMNKVGVSCYVSCCFGCVGLCADDVYRCIKCNLPSGISPNYLTYHGMVPINTLYRYAKRLSSESETYILEQLKRCEKVASYLNYAMVDFYYNTFIRALQTKCHRLAEYLEPKVTAALTYYFPEGHMRRAALPMTRSYWTFEGRDNYDVRKGFEAAVLTFGEDHPVVLQFKRDIEKYIIDKMEHLVDDEKKSEKTNNKKKNHKSRRGGKGH